MRRTRWQIVALLVLLGGCGSKEESNVPAVSAAPQATIQAAVVEVKLSDVPIRMEVTGQVETVYQATLSSRIQGTIDRVSVLEGTEVKKGQTLIELDNRDLQAELARAAAEVENAKANFSRMKSLYAEDAVSKQEMENATRAFKVAEANRKAVLAQLSYTVVRAPFDGVITEKKVEAGELASPGQALLKMEDPNRLRLEATVAESDLKAIGRGDRIRVIIDALPSESLIGVVSQILPAGDPQTHTFAVKVDLPKTPGLKSGMFGRLQLDKGISRTIVLPSSAVIERGEMTSVFVVDPDHVARLRWVRIGRRFNQQAEILSGINEGEHVLTDASRGTEGAIVQVHETVRPQS
ncbi:MAG TPA: efflux RND transporter periplasmic adaptor subunit [Nitrospira sp.]|nr:efflux RND transporter periplasmic adaptor subunit [Nitrospira sp.]